MSWPCRPKKSRCCTVVRQSNQVSLALAELSQRCRLGRRASGKTHGQRHNFGDRKMFSPGLALFSTQPCSGLMKELVVRWLHMTPEAQEEIERTIGQSLPRSGLTKLAT